MYVCISVINISLSNYFSVYASTMGIAFLVTCISYSYFCIVCVLLLFALGEINILGLLLLLPTHLLVTSIHRCHLSYRFISQKIRTT